MTGTTYRPVPAARRSWPAWPDRRARGMRARLGPARTAIDMAAMEHHYAHLVNSDPAGGLPDRGAGRDTVGYARVEWHDLADGDRIYDHTTDRGARRLGPGHRRCVPRVVRGPPAR